VYLPPERMADRAGSARGGKKKRAELIRVRSKK